VMAAALWRQVANTNSRMLMWTPEVLLNVSDSFADLLTFLFGKARSRPSKRRRDERYKISSMEPVKALLRPFVIRSFALT
jgi:hypothetical protein